MSQPSISIVTVCKNSARTIEKTIKSVIDQAIDDLEYIIIDGCSTDGTLQIIDSYSEKIDILVSEPDKGISDAFNKGIALASGKLIGLINSDDILLNGSLRKVIDFFEENKKVQVMHGDVLFYDGDLFIKRISPPAHWWLPWRMCTFNIHAATFVRKEVYSRYGNFDTSYRFAMDDDLFLKWVSAGVAIAYLPEPFAGVQAGGVSGRHAFKVIVEKRRALVENGFSRFLPDIQCVSRCVLQLIVMLQQIGRKVSNGKQRKQTLE